MIIPEGYVMAPGESVVSPNQLYVTPGYLEALRVPLKRGRFFTESDTPTRAARRHRRRAAGASGSGRTPIRSAVACTCRSARKTSSSRGPGAVWLQVVGVVGSVKLRGLVEGEDARAGAYYLPYAQDPSRGIGFAIRTRGDSDPASVTAAVQRTLASIDPEMQLSDTFAMPERIGRRSTRARRRCSCRSRSARVALLLAAIGIYGVLAYQVSQRTREIGIRMALGSDPAGILRLVLREGVGLLLVGLAGGMPGAIALRGVIASQLFGVGALDTGVILAVTGVLALAALAASLGPARRAARVDPVVALSAS